MTASEKARRADAVAELRETLRKGDEIHLVLNSVSESGMTRWVTPYFFVPAKTPSGGRSARKVDRKWLGFWVSEALGLTLVGHERIKLEGCGMDMGFALVYDLSSVLYGDGYQLIHRWL